MLARHTAVILVGLFASWLQGCQTANLEKLPAYDRALAMPQHDPMRCYLGQEIDPTAFPAVAPFAILSTSSGWGELTARRFLKERADKTLHPDVIFFYDSAPYYAGSITSATAVPTASGAFGLGLSTPMYMKEIYAVCFRLLPSRVGLQWDETGMVVSLSDNAKAAGVLEGDRIVSFNGAPVEFGPKALRSAYHAHGLDVRPGSDIHLVWIRPGTGRMEGVCKALDNPPVHLQIPQLDIPAPPPVTD